MTKFPPEIDRLMWAVAENPSPQAVLEFESRYPQYRLEMLKRVEMVRSLRTEVKRPNGHVREIPKFDPAAHRPQGLPRGAAIAGALALFAVAFASYTAFHSPKPVLPKPAVVMNFDSTPEPNSGVIYKTPPAQPLPAPPPVQNSVPQIQSQPAAEVPRAEQRRDLRLKDVDLVAALSLITAGTHIKLEVGPGFVNQKVTLNFGQATTREMLVQMAKDYAFTVSDEGDNNYLVLPVPDREASMPPSTDPSRRIGP